MKGGHVECGQKMQLINLILLDTCHFLSSFVILSLAASCPCQERHQATLHDPQEHRDMQTRYDKIILLNRGEHGIELEQLLSTNLVYAWTFATSNKRLHDTGTGGSKL